jgi:hypothetical protein
MMSRRPIFVDPASSAAMQLGETLTYHGHELVLIGLDPMSLPDAQAELEDPCTGGRVYVPIAELEADLPAAGVSGFPG